MRDIGGAGYSNDNKLNGASDGSRDRIAFKGNVGRLMTTICQEELVFRALMTRILQVQ